jgi:hypothetical protein
MHGGQVLASLNLLWVSEVMGTEEFARKHLSELKKAAEQLSKRFAKSDRGTTYKNGQLQ